MGGGSYSHIAREDRATRAGYYTKSTREVFSRRSINSQMSPYGLGVRESRDGTEHPDSFPIIIALDVTGSMGSIPAFLVKNGLPDIMKKILDAGIKDPQVLFLGVGDHEYDDAPIQVGQFESSDELLDHWLTNVYLEGGGGGNDGESYLLAWYVAGYHTSIDSFEKRGKKGVLITIGDEPTLKEVPARVLDELFGKGQHTNVTASELLDKAREMYHCYHLHICQTGAGSRERTKQGWKQLMGDENLRLVQHKEDVADEIAQIVIKEYGTIPAANKPAVSAAEASAPESSKEDWI